ncbi:follistatin-like isoform X1 [Centruroides vittatus]|uniref:follistatin-like isoform X1 n=2 Tax=Centruroides vittatus TaxID=120091 RepID=UPI00350FA2CB
MQSKVLLFLVILIINFNSNRAGYCWAKIGKNGGCSQLLMNNVTRKECCLGSNSYGWSNEKHRSGSLFYWKIVGNLYPCRPCKVNCFRNDCNSNCTRKNLCTFKKQQSGPVCGTDGQTYANQCKLLKQQCRRGNKLKIAYFGPCQNSCEKVKCLRGKSCFLDHYHRPHCVRCHQDCPASVKNHVICTINNITHHNYCTLRQEACKLGYMVSVAYKGQCREFENCDMVNCPKQSRCIFDHVKNIPLCVNCPMSCSSWSPFCASDGNTYDSLCHLEKEICRKGVKISVVNDGPCNSPDEMPKNSKDDD